MTSQLFNSETAQLQLLQAQLLSDARFELSPQDLMAGFSTTQGECSSSNGFQLPSNSNDMYPAMMDEAVSNSNAMYPAMMDEAIFWSQMTTFLPQSTNEKNVGSFPSLDTQDAFLDRSSALQLNADATNFFQETCATPASSNSLNCSAIYGDVASSDPSTALADVFERECSPDSEYFQAQTRRNSLVSRVNDMSLVNSSEMYMENPTNLIPGPPMCASPSEPIGGLMLGSSYLQHQEGSTYLPDSFNAAPTSHQPERNPVIRNRKRSYSTNHLKNPVVPTARHRRSSLSSGSTIPNNFQGVSSMDRSALNRDEISSPASRKSPYPNRSPKAGRRSSIAYSPSPLSASSLPSAPIVDATGRPLSVSTSHHGDINGENLKTPPSPIPIFESFTSGEDLEKIDFDDVTVCQLKTHLRRLQLSATGKKEVLISRLKCEIENIKKKQTEPLDSDHAVSVTDPICISDSPIDEEFNNNYVLQSDSQKLEQELMNSAVGYSLPDTLTDFTYNDDSPITGLTSGDDFVLQSDKEIRHQQPMGDPSHLRAPVLPSSASNAFQLESAYQTPMDLLMGTNSPPVPPFGQFNAGPAAGFQDQSNLLMFARV